MVIPGVGAVACELGTPVGTLLCDIRYAPGVPTAQRCLGNNRDGCPLLYMGTSLLRNRQPPPGQPQGPRHGPTVESWGVAVSYERGIPVTFTLAPVTSVEMSPGFCDDPRGASAFIRPSKHVHRE